MVHNLFNKKSVLLAGKSVSVSPVKSEIMSNQQLVEQLHKPIIRKFEIRKVHSPIIDNIGGADLANISFSIMCC